MISWIFWWITNDIRHIIHLYKKGKIYEGIQDSMNLWQATMKTVIIFRQPPPPPPPPIVPQLLMLNFPNNNNNNTIGFLYSAHSVSIRLDSPGAPDYYPCFSMAATRSNISRNSFLPGTHLHHLDWVWQI